jgi:hypothetical protein
MLRTALAALAITGALAASPANAMINCANDYKDFWEKLMREAGSAKMTGEQVAGVNRAALRAYDACTAGDESFAKQLFEKLAREAGSAKK